MAERASERKQKAFAETEGLSGVLEPMVRAGLSYEAMADALADVASSAVQCNQLTPTQIGRILQRLGLSGKLLGSDQTWGAT